MTVWVVALVSVGKFGGFEPVGGTYAATDDGFEEPLSVWVVSIVKIGVFFFEIGARRIVIDVGCNPNQVFAVSWWFEVLGFTPFFCLRVSVEVVVFILIRVVLPPGDSVFEVF